MDKRTFNFSVAILQDAATAITAAATAHSALNPRLKAGLLAATVQLNDDVTGAINNQMDKEADVGDLTIEQDAAVVVMKDKVAAARKAARRAFKGDDVKLHDEFQVGGSSREPNGLPDILKRAKIVLGGCKNTENTQALADVGWLAADTTELEDAITTASGADLTQNTAKSAPVDATTDLTTKANGLHANLLVIQNAADLQWPGRNPANKGVRKEFRLDTFPPRNHEKKPNTPKNVTVAPGPAGSARLDVDWDASTGAENNIVRVTNKASGAEITTVTTSASFVVLTLTGTPAGTEVNVTITAHNNKGDSAPSAPVTAVVP